MKLPIIKDLHIEKFTGVGIDVSDYFNQNAIIGQYSDTRIYATQRPSIDIFEEPTEPVTEAGRGIYFWDHPNVNARYIVINNEVFKGSASTPAIATISGGTQKVFFVEMVNWLVILDPENNEGWWILQSDDTAVVEIVDVSFPPKRTPTVQLAGGGAFLDGHLYVGGTDGAIYNSDSNTPVDWEDLGKVSAERKADGGIYLDIHHNDIVLFGSRTIEFFYNAANPFPASPLSRRRDVAFLQYGMVDRNSAWREGDNIYFIGLHPSGATQVLKLAQYQPEKISSDTIDSYVGNARFIQKSLTVASGFSAAERTFFILTFYRIQGGVISPDITIVFDGMSWGKWDTDLLSIDRFPLVGWTVRGGTEVRPGEGIMSNGDLITVNDNFKPQDTLLCDRYIATGYYAGDGYYVAQDCAGTTYDMIVGTGPFDGGTNKWKFGHRLEIVGDETEAATDATVRWADGNSVDFNAGRTIDLSVKQSTDAIGRFKRRNFEVVINSTEQYRIEALELDFTEGGH